MAERKSVFISHTTKHPLDLRLAHDLDAGLTTKNWETWIAPKNVPIGNLWEPKLVRTIILDCTHFVVILSAAAIHLSQWVPEEIRLALDRGEHQPGFKIVWIQLDEVNNYEHMARLKRYHGITYTHDHLADHSSIVDLVVQEFDKPSPATRVSDEDADDWTAAYRAVVERNSGSWAADRIWGQHRELAEAPAARLPAEPGFLASDGQEAEQVREAIQRWLARPSDSLPKPELLAAPFDEDPAVVAHWLLGELLEGPGCERVPLVLPLATLGSHAAGGRTPPERLAEAIRAEYQLNVPTASQLSAALRRPGQFVVILYATPSSQWWVQTPAESDVMRRALRFLVEPPPTSGLAPQLVVVVCADDHHRTEWGGKGKDRFG